MAFKRSAVRARSAPPKETPLGSGFPRASSFACEVHPGGFTAILLPFALRMHPVHDLGRLGVLSGHQVSVSLQREGFVCVTESAGDRLDVPSLIQQDGNVGMPEGVEIDPFHNIA